MFQAIGAQSIVKGSANSGLQGTKNHRRASAPLLVRARCGKPEIFLRHRSCSSLMEKKAFKEDGTKEGMAIVSKSPAPIREPGPAKRPRQEPPDDPPSKQDPPSHEPVRKDPDGEDSPMKMEVAT